MAQRWEAILFTGNSWKEQKNQAPITVLTNGFMLLEALRYLLQAA